MRRDDDPIRRTVPRIPRAAWAAAWRTLVLALDAGLVYGSLYAAYLARFHFPLLLRLIPLPGGAATPWAHYAAIAPLIVFLWVFVFFYSCRLYGDPWLAPADQIVKLIRGSVESLAWTLAGSFALHRQDDSRLMLLIMAPIALASLAAARTLLNWGLRWALASATPKPLWLLVGNDKTSDFLRRRISQLNGRGLAVMPPSPAEEIYKFSLERGVSEVIVTNVSAGRGELLALADRLEEKGIAFRIIPSLLELRMGEVWVDRYFGIPSLRLRHLSLEGQNFIFKRAFDLAFSVLLILAGSPLFAMIALWIKLDSKGPVFFKQKRVGYRGRAFEAYKFRTMAADAESRVVEIKAGNGAAAGPYLKVRGDHRITRAGRWLRRLSLDEIPQFINVFKGEMSVVGPRPLAVSGGELTALESSYGELARKILNVRPGITGLWQVSGRSALPPEERFALDLFYIESWSPALDLKIILRTLPAMISGAGAY